MARITKDESVTLTTADAMRLARNVSGKVRFQVRVDASLPIEGEPEKYFPGATYLSVSRADFLKVLGDICGEVLERRGGRIGLRLHAPTFEGGLSFVSLA